MTNLIATIIALLFGLIGVAYAQPDDPMQFDRVSTTDLASALHTKTNWRLVVTHEPYDGDAGSSAVGNLHFCFTNGRRTACPKICYPSGVLLDHVPQCSDKNETLYDAFDNVTAFPSVGRSKAALVVAMVGLTGGASGFWAGPIIWAYDRQTDRFEHIFSAVENPSNNGRVRFIVDGSIAGDVVLDQLTHRWPYRYNIKVYRLIQSERYIKVLDYNGNSTEGDGNALPVIDAEMPEIERRLGVWKPWDPLPVVVQNNISSQCKTPVRLQNGLAWCDWSTQG